MNKGWGTKIWGVGKNTSLKNRMWKYSTIGRIERIFLQIGRKKYSGEAEGMMFSRRTWRIFLQSVSGEGMMFSNTRLVF